MRRYNKGQIIYYSSDHHVYLLLDGIVLRETINEDGDAYRKLNKEQLLFPLNHLFRKIELNEM